jgi:hypothetical protein
MSKTAVDDALHPPAVAKLAAAKDGLSPLIIAVVLGAAAIVGLLVALGAAVFPVEPDMPAPWEAWVRSTSLHRFITANAWNWPALETLHYLGLSTLLGTVGLFDLRVLGMAKSIPPAALHRLIPIGVAAYILNLITGICFFSAFPEQYFYNPSFWWKALFMGIAGVNVAAFYVSPAFREVKLLPSGADAPFVAKLMAGTSLGAWIGVLICGRLLTFFRPLFFH